MSNIIILSGAKQSGKSSTNAFLHGYVMRDKLHMIERFWMDDDGHLLIPVRSTDAAGNIEEKWGIFDVDRQDAEFQEYAASTFWNEIKGYSYANSLKTIAMRLFGLSYEQCYGTNEQKNTPTQVKWKDMLFALDSKRKKEVDKSAYLTAREFLQVFGTDICRRIFGDCFVLDVLNQIEEEQPKLAIVVDGRFENEIEIPRSRGAKSLRLKKRLEAVDSHKSETALDDYNNHDAEIDNQNMTIIEKSQAVLDVVQGWGYL